MAGGEIPLHWATGNYWLIAVHTVLIYMILPSRPKVIYFREDNQTPVACIEVCFTCPQERWKLFHLHSYFKIGLGLVQSDKLPSEFCKQVMLMACYSSSPSHTMPFFYTRESYLHRYQQKYKKVINQNQFL